MSHLKTYISSNGHKVHQISAIDNLSGLPAFYFLMVNSRQKEAGLQNAIASGEDINLTEYGEIIASCTGFEPTDEVKAYLKENYGFNI